MASKVSNRGTMISFCVFVLLAMAGNVWISGELKSLEKASGLVAISEAEAAAQGEDRPVYGIVKIDPANDPMTPMIVRVKPVEPVSQTARPQAYFEGPVDTPILIQ